MLLGLCPCLFIISEGEGDEGCVNYQVSALILVPPTPHLFLRNLSKLHVKFSVKILILCLFIQGSSGFWVFFPLWLLKAAFQFYLFWTRILTISSFFVTKITFP